MIFYNKFFSIINLYLYTKKYYNLKWNFNKIINNRCIKEVEKNGHKMKNNL